jgi:hypothetical protein
MRGGRRTSELNDIRRLQESSRRIPALLRTIPAVDAHNRLMSVPDRTLALAVLYLGDQDRRDVLSRLSPPKAGRVTEEFELSSRRRMSLALPASAVETVCSALAGQSVAGASSYIRPRRNKP